MVKRGPYGKKRFFSRMRREPVEEKLQFRGKREREIIERQNPRSGLRVWNLEHGSGKELWTRRNPTSSETEGKDAYMRGGEGGSARK